MECENTNSTCISFSMKSCVCREWEKWWGGSCLFPGWNTTADKSLILPDCFSFSLETGTLAQQSRSIGVGFRPRALLLWWPWVGHFSCGSCQDCSEPSPPSPRLSKHSFWRTLLSLIFFRWLNCYPQMNIPRISADNTVFDSLTHIKLLNWRLDFHHGHKRYSSALSALLCNQWAHLLLKLAALNFHELVKQKLCVLEQLLLMQKKRSPLFQMCCMEHLL